MLFVITSTPPTPPRFFLFIYLIVVASISSFLKISISRHNDGAGLRKERDGNSSFEEDAPVDVYPLKLRISVIRDTCIMTVKITKKVCALYPY